MQTHARALFCHVSWTSYLPVRSRGQAPHHWSGRLLFCEGPGEGVNICWIIIQSTVVWLYLISEGWEFHCQAFIVSLSPKILLFVISICYEWDEIWQHLHHCLAERTACAEFLWFFKFRFEWILCVSVSLLKTWYLCKVFIWREDFLLFYIYSLNSLCYFKLRRIHSKVCSVHSGASFANLCICIHSCNRPPRSR